MRLTTIDGLVAPGHLACELWALRLLVNAQAWKALDKDTFDECANDFTLPIRGYQAFHARMLNLYEAFEKQENLEHRECPSNFGGQIQCMRERKFAGVKDFTTPPKELVDALVLCEKEAQTRPLFLSPFAENLDMLARMFHLDNDTKQVFAFLLWVKFSMNMQTVANLFNYEVGGMKLMCEIIACVTKVDLLKVHKLLEHDSVLSRTLIRINAQGRDIEDNFEINDAFDMSLLTMSRITKDDFLEARLAAAQEPELTLQDFDHIPRVKSVLLPYLRTAMQEQHLGVNVLLYGVPGTGKTELSRVLAKELNAQLFEVACKDAEIKEDKYGDKKKQSRLDHWHFANQLLKDNVQALLVLDEAEDVFASGVSFFGMQMDAPVRTNKAQINKLLETNTCPTVWMTNSLRTIDSAMVRRFDILLEVAQPTTEQRRKIIDRLTGDSLSENVCNRLAHTQDLSPAIIQRALKVADTVEPERSAKRDELLVDLVNDTLLAQGRDLVRSSADTDKNVYSLEFVNADADLAKLIKGIGCRSRARLCLYGIPGTGKSAYAAWLAKELDKPLLVKRASDLLDCYVGMTEQNIAKAFQEAKREGAVLLIDEADSFLQDRTKSRQSWEMTQVNEMLTQIEQFEGILIVTTNLVDTLDPASIRRFDIKVKFDALTPVQTQNLFERYAQEFGITSTVIDGILREVRALSVVAPGDFAAVARQNGFSPIGDAKDFLGRLQAECGLKKDNQRRPIGFG